MATPRQKAFCVLEFNFFVWRYVKDKVYVPPLPADISDMKDRIIAAVNTVDGDILKRVLEKFSYWLDVVRATGGGHMEHL